MRVAFGPPWISLTYLLLEFYVDFLIFRQVNNCMELVEFLTCRQVDVPNNKHILACLLTIQLNLQYQRPHPMHRGKCLPSSNGIEIISNCTMDGKMLANANKLTHSEMTSNNNALVSYIWVSTPLLFEDVMMMTLFRLAITPTHTLSWIQIYSLMSPESTLWPNNFWPSIFAGRPL